MKNKTRIFSSYIFMASLLLLLLNDFVLKETYGNWLTGKLSDVTGLFVFCIFWIALFPKHQSKIVILIIFVFIWWKSPVSAGFISAWNVLPFFKISRVVDMSDLVALLAVPVAYFCFWKKNSLKTVKIRPVFPLLLSVFAFCATSKPRDVVVPVYTTFHFSASKGKVLVKINRIIRDKESENLPLSTKDYSNTASDWDDTDRIWYHIARTQFYYDTLWKYKKVLPPDDKGLYTSEKTNIIDTVYRIRVDEKDSALLSHNGIFLYKIKVFNYPGHEQSGYNPYLCGKLQLLDDTMNGGCFLTLVSVRVPAEAKSFLAENDHKKEFFVSVFKSELSDSLKDQP